MTLQDFKLKMISELSSIYEMDELNSIFNLLTEDYLKISRSKILLADEIHLDESNQTLFLNALEISIILSKSSTCSLIGFKIREVILALLFLDKRASV